MKLTFSLKCTFLKSSNAGTFHINVAMLHRLPSLYFIHLNSTLCYVNYPSSLCLNHDFDDDRLCTGNGGV